MDFWIPLFGGALGAALINSIVAVYKLNRDTDVEHDQWTRNEKLKTYSQFLSDINPLSVQTLLMLYSDDEKAIHEYDRVRANGFVSMLLVANEDVMDRATKLINLTRKVRTILGEGTIRVLQEVVDRGASLTPDEIYALVNDASREGAGDLVEEIYEQIRLLTMAMRRDLGLVGELELTITRQVA